MALVMALPTAEWHVLIFLWPTAPHGSFQVELAKRALGADHKTTLDFQWGYSRAFTLDKDVSAEQLAEVATTLEKTLKTAQRVLGREHPRTGNIRYALEECKKLVTARRGET